MNDTPAEQANRIYVGNIDYRLTIPQLQLLFESCGAVSDVFLPLAPATSTTRLNRGYAFVTFCRPECAAHAVAHYNATLEPTFRRILVVQPAKPRP